MPGYVAKGSFTGMITQFRNTSIIMAMQPCVTLLQEIAGNDEFKSRAGTDDSTQMHFIQLIAACDKMRKMITYNPDSVNLQSIQVGPEIKDVKKEQTASTKPFSFDGIQLGSSPEIEIPYRFDGTDPNLPLASALTFRNGVGVSLYTQACLILVNYTRLESRNRAQMITVYDSLRMYSYMQSFRDLCENLLGEKNAMDVAQPLATDEPAGMPLPNRVGEASVSVGSSLQNGPQTTSR